MTLSPTPAPTAGDTDTPDIIAYTGLYGSALYVLCALAVVYNPASFLLGDTLGGGGPSATIGGFPRHIMTALLLFAWIYSMSLFGGEADTNWRTYLTLALSGILTFGIGLFNTMRAMAIDFGIVIGGESEQVELRERADVEFRKPSYGVALVPLATILAYVVTHIIYIYPTNEQMGAAWPATDNDAHAYEHAPVLSAISGVLIVGLMMLYKIAAVPAPGMDGGRAVPALQLRAVNVNYNKDGSKVPDGKVLKAGLAFSYPLTTDNRGMDTYLTSQYVVSLYELIAVHAFLLMFNVVFYRNTAYGVAATLISTAPALYLAKRLGWGTWLECFMWNQALYHLTNRFVMGSAYGDVEGVSILGSNAIWEANLADEVTTSGMYTTMALLGGVCCAAGAWNFGSALFDPVATMEVDEDGSGRVRSS